MSAYRLHIVGEVETYSIDWDDDWLPSGDTLQSATWTISPSGPTITDLGEASNVASVRVEGVTAGVLYRLTCSMVSTGGETGKQRFAIRAWA